MAAEDHLSGQQFDANELLQRPTAERPFLHGTNADLSPGDVLTAGRDTTFGNQLDHVYLTSSPSSAHGYAQTRALKHGGTGRVYAVEPHSDIEPDPETVNMSGYESERRTSKAKVLGEVKYPADWY